MSMESMPGHQKPEGATTVFVLGLLGLIFCALLGVVAWVQGNDYLKRCQSMGVEPDGLAVAGRIMGMIATVLMILGLIGFVFAMMLGVLAGAAGM